MFKKVYQFRIEIYFVSLLSILFGSIFFHHEVFHSYIIPFLSVINIIAGVLFFTKSNKIYKFLIVIFAIALITTIYEVFFIPSKTIGFFKFSTYFLFYILVTYELILKVWKSKNVNKTVIIGLMSGYVSLGFIALFLFLGIELANPNSFSGLTQTGNFLRFQIDELLYLSYISLMTIGYGDIVPSTSIAQKATILVGLLGQFYTVILTGIIVGKFLNQQKKND